MYISRNQQVHAIDRWSRAITLKSLYSLALFVVTHISMSFVMSKSHRFAISRHFGFPRSKQKVKRAMFFLELWRFLPRSIVQLSRQCAPNGIVVCLEPRFPHRQWKSGHVRITEQSERKSSVFWLLTTALRYTRKERTKKLWICWKLWVTSCCWGKLESLSSSFFYYYLAREGGVHQGTSFP